mmetsp:Transcript_34519/g.96853  ORF Transcript_34519/g.96853 Transcript_34519/m.96853 type:complete len:406 (-) Transcript_34519:7-1224(-)
MPPKARPRSAPRRASPIGREAPKEWPNKEAFKMVSDLAPKPKAAATVGRPYGSSARGSSTPSRQGRNNARSPARNRPSSVPPRKPPDSPAPSWLHPHGTPLEDLEENATMRGVVANVAPFGVFIDVGAERNAILGIQARYWKHFRRGDRLDHCVMQDLNLQTRRFSVTIEDPEAAIAANHVPLEDIAEGTYVDGVVVDKSPAGTFVNIGAVKDGRLAVPRSFGIKLMRGQVLRNILIQKVNLTKKWIALRLENPRAAIAEVEMVGFHLTKGMGRAKTQTQPKTKAKAKPVPTAPKIKAAPPPAPEMDFMQGDFVDGVVTSIATKGVLVNIGAETLGTLVVSAELKNEFQKGDKVQGMKIEKITSSGAITLSMEDPELEVDEMIVLPKPKAKTKAKGRSKSRLGAK